jgi:hypothetical protein
MRRKRMIYEERRKEAISKGEKREMMNNGRMSLDNRYD